MEYNRMHGTMGLFHILAGRYDPDNHLERQLPTSPPISKTTPNPLELVLWLPQCRWRAGQPPGVWQVLTGKGRASCLANMSRCLAARGRSTQSLLGPGSSGTGIKWWHQSKGSSCQGCHSESDSAWRSRESSGNDTANSWLQCVEIYPKVTHNHADVPEGRPKGEKKKKSKPTK